ncbi:unnamed protein product [Urochloa humidicola]
MASEENTDALSAEKPATRIPPDVIEEILLRLPIISLLRLRRVCKRWRNMISTPHFIKEHACRAPKHLLLYFPKTLKPCRATIIDEKWSSLTWAASHMDPDDHLFVSCNGLLCFYKTMTYTLKIANPATGHCLQFSKPDGISLHDFHYLYSFGFHPTTGEYKLVHFLREPQRCMSGQPFHFDTIQLYTLGDDRWRNIKGVIGSLPRRAKLAPGSQAGGNQALQVQQLCDWLIGSFQPGCRQTLFGRLNEHVRNHFYHLYAHLRAHGCIARAWLARNEHFLRISGAWLQLAFCIPRDRLQRWSR